VVPTSDLRLEDGQELLLGEHALLVMETPGHTPCSVCYSIAGRVLTGDALPLRAWADALPYPGPAADPDGSIQKKLYQLPEETLVLPAHATSERLSSTIGFEKKHMQPFAGSGQEASL
jgi:hydroxyacylglutathione hydrolase